MIGITSDNINIIRDDIFKNYKINLQNPTRISQDEFLDFDKLKNDASFAKWYSGINPKTGRKISINGKVHNEIKQMHQFKSYDYYKSIDDISNRLDYLEESKLLMDNYIENKKKD
jgi:hypothetical protein